MAYTPGNKIITYKRSFLPFHLLYHLCVFLVRFVSWTLLRIRISGRENLQGIDSALLVSNHTLVLDPGIIAYAIRPKRTYFTMLEETALIPYLGTFIRLLGGIPIPPNSFSRLEKAVEQGINELGFVHFFPEGECFLRNQQIRPFSIGAFYLSCRLRLPIVPITTVLLERSFFGKPVRTMFGGCLRVPPRVSIYIGKPFYPEQFIPELDGPQAGNKRSRRIIVRRQAVTAMSEEVRRYMQATIDNSGGCKTMFRGVMPRLVKQETSGGEEEIEQKTRGKAV